MLRGWGLVVGLNGTGEANDATNDAGDRSGDGNHGQPGCIAGRAAIGLRRTQEDEECGAGDGHGHRAGDRRASRRQGRLLRQRASTARAWTAAGWRSLRCMGPNTEDKRVYALCQGQVTIDNPQQPMVGVIHAGCQLEADIFTPFYRDGYITLILDKNHADFQTANEIVQFIREKVALFRNRTTTKSSEDMVRAIDASNIMVRIPEYLSNDPVAFASDLLEIRMEEPQTESRVVINPRAGTIVISGDVEIGDVIVSHKNVVVDATTAPTFAAIDVGSIERAEVADARGSAQFAEGADGRHDRDHQGHRAERKIARAVDY